MDLLFSFWSQKVCCGHIMHELANTCGSLLHLSRPGRYFKGCCGRWEARATSTALDDFQSQQQTPSSLLHPLICAGLVTDTRRNFSPPLPMDLIAGGLHSYALVFAVFFFPPTSPAAKVKWHHVEKEVGLNIYPQGPAGEPGTDGRRRIWSTGGWDILPVASEKLFPGSSLWSAASGGLKRGKYLLVFWSDVDREREGWESFDTHALRWKAIWTYPDGKKEHKAQLNKEKFVAL